MTEERSPNVVIHPAKLPALSADRLRVEPDANGVVATDPERSGWRYLSFRTLRLADGAVVVVREPDRETVVVTVSGGGVDVVFDGGPVLSLVGRSSVFEGMPWSAYVPAGHEARIIGRPLPGMEAVVALAHAPSSGRAGVATEPILVGPTTSRSRSAAPATPAARSTTS